MGEQNFAPGVKPDVFDAHDLEYRPKLQLLLPEVWPLSGGAILHRTRAGGGDRHGAGAGDAGSSLRGALKGWFHHGVVDTLDWAALNTPVPDLEDENFRVRCARMPLGASCRANPYRLSSMQSGLLASICTAIRPAAPPPSPVPSAPEVGQVTAPGRAA